MSTLRRKNVLLIRYTLWATAIYVVVMGIGWAIVERYTSGLYQELFRKQALQVQSQMELFIDAKAESVFELALALSQDRVIKQAFLNTMPIRLICSRWLLCCAIR